MADLNTDIRFIKGVGETRARALEKLHIRTLGDLISYYPRRWEDRTKLFPIRDLPEGEYACCRAMLAQEPTAHRISGGQTVVKVRAVDEGGVLDITFFHQEYRKNALHRGETYIFYGRAEGGGIRRRMANPLLEKEGGQQLTGRIMPVYPLTAGITQIMMAKAVRQGLDECRDLPEDVLPDEIRRAHHLCYAGFALENIHFPASPEALNTARRRLVFEELFLLSCGLSLLRQRRESVHGLPCRAADMSDFYAALPFALTAAQRRAIEDAVGDMTSGRPMNRLCQGDVGSGKTMVAAACVWFCRPERLAVGADGAHGDTGAAALRKPCASVGPLRPALRPAHRLHAGQRAPRYRSRGCKPGTSTLCIGTHALLTEDVTYNALGLVITDEQHRFGVDQRSALSRKGTSPHLLVHVGHAHSPHAGADHLRGSGRVDHRRAAAGPTAGGHLRGGGERTACGSTPSSASRWPRDIRCSSSARWWGRRTTCPTSARLPPPTPGSCGKRRFPTCGCRCSTVSMKAGEKEKVMTAFAAGESDILVSTTVVEVGVDVPNATLMVVENADRFGLSQLHQLRGRVGRGKAQSLLCPAQRHTECGDAPPPEGAGRHQRRFPHRGGGSEAAGTRRLLRQPSARPAHAEGRRSQLRYAASCRGAGRRPDPDGRRSPPDSAGARRAAPPHPGAVRPERGHAELK